MTNKPNKRDSILAARVLLTAEVCGVSPNEVYKVIRDQRKNEVVISIFMTAKEKEQEIKKDLVKLVEELVPFDKEYRRKMPKQQIA